MQSLLKPFGMFSFLKQYASYLYAFAHTCSSASPHLCSCPSFTAHFNATAYFPVSCAHSLLWTSIMFCNLFLVDDGYLNLFNSDMFVSLPPWDVKLSEAETMFGLPSYPSHIVGQWSVVELTLASAVSITSDLLHIPEWWCWLLRGLQVTGHGWQLMLLTCHEPWEQPEEIPLNPSYTNCWVSNKEDSI